MKKVKNHSTDFYKFESAIKIFQPTIGWLAGLFISVTLVGCSNPLSDGTKIGEDYHPGTNPTPTKKISSDLSVNSAGVVQAKGQAISANATVLQRHVKMSGTTVSAKISFHSGRVSQ